MLAGLDGATGARLMVRINSLRTVEGIADMHAFLVRRHLVAALVLPKVETDDEVRWAAVLADDAGSPLKFLCIIETTAGLEELPSHRQGAFAPVGALFRWLRQVDRPGC